MNEGSAVSDGARVSAITHAWCFEPYLSLLHCAFQHCFRITQEEQYLQTELYLKMKDIL